MIISEMKRRLLNIFLVAPEAPHREEPPVSLCKHVNWAIYGWNTFRPAVCGTCLDCHREVGLEILLNGFREQVLERMKELEDTVSKQGKPPAYHGPLFPTF